MRILVLNSGSSSLKYQVFNVENDNYDVIAKGMAERIGENISLINYKSNKTDKIEKELSLPSHNEAITEVLNFLQDEKIGVIQNIEELSAIGHRVVHGGEEFKSSVKINSEVYNKIDNLSSLAPLHNPANLLGIKAISDLLPEIPQVAVFDTAFHQTMPEKAFLYGLPIDQYKNHKIRRYGFHGTSHNFVSKECAKLMGKSIKDLKIVTCHIGNGASLAAIDGGICVDTSMGFTPLAGVMMGTRTGDMDPYIPLHIMKDQNLSIDEVNAMMNKKSGMIGLYNSNDLRDVEAGYEKGDKDATIALETYVYKIQKYIGSYITAMNGVDAIIFTAGVGENSNNVRELVCKNFSYIGLELNKDANDTRGTIEISSDNSKVKVFVIPTDEELVIAKDTVALI